MHNIFIYILVFLLGVATFAGVSKVRDDAPAPATDTATEPTQQTLDDTPPLDATPATGPTIDLSGQGLTKVPEYIFKETGTVTLDLSGNKFTGALPGEIRHLQNLKTLDLSDNTFTGVPAEIGQLAKLETLDLSGNPITGLPYELANLKNLKVLDLSGTQYAAQDLEVIKKGLPASVVIKL